MTTTSLTENQLDQIERLLGAELDVELRFGPLRQLIGQPWGAASKPDRYVIVLDDTLTGDEIVSALEQAVAALRTQSQDQITELQAIKKELAELKSPEASELAARADALEQAMEG